MKSFPLIFAVVAAASPVVARAEERANTRAPITTPEVTTSTPAEPAPATDIRDISTRTHRDFVKDPLGFSGAATMGGGFSDAYGFGLGARAGYTLPYRIYLGGMYEYHFGTSEDKADVTVGRKSQFLGVEAGYDVGVGYFIVRPVFGVGAGWRKDTVEGPLAKVSDTDTKVYLAPGASVMYPIGNFFLGADARMMFMTDNSAFTLSGAGGVHL